jgi:hypothetical protein
MTPRHPPRALRSLTTPIRPPLLSSRDSCESQVPSRDSPTGGDPTLPIADGPGVLTTRVRPSYGNDSVCGATSPSRRGCSAIHKGPLSWRDSLMPLPHVCVCTACVTNNRIVTELPGRRARCVTERREPPNRAPSSDPHWPLARERGRLFRDGRVPHPARWRSRGQNPVFSEENGVRSPWIDRSCLRGRREPSWGAGVESFGRRVRCRRGLIGWVSGVTP